MNWKEKFATLLTSFLIITMTQKYMKSWQMKEPGTEPNASSKQSTYIWQTEEIWRKVTKITDYGSLTCLDEVRRLSLLLDVLAELMEGSSEAAEQQLDYPGSTYVRYLVDYLDSHYAEKIRLSQIAEKIGVSRSYLTHSFKTLMHMPPKEYLTRVRMRQASQLLLTTAKTITEISRLCGYDDSMAFDKAFRNYYQENPGTYRKNYKAHGDERPYGAMYSLNSVL